MYHYFKRYGFKACRPLSIYVLAVVIVTSALINPMYATARSSEEIQREIDAITEDIQSATNEIEELQSKEDTLENRLDQLAADVKKAEAELERTTQKIASVRERIAETKRELARKKELIQANAQTIYKNGDPSTLEILFSSNNFTDFINQREDLERTKDSLNDAAEEVVSLQESLKAKDAELKTLKQQQTSDKNALEHKRIEQQELLEETRGEEERYQELRDRQKSEREQLEEQQRQAYARELAAAREANQFVSNSNQTGNSSNQSGGSSSYVGTSSYPWAQASTSAVDEWGLYARQCVSYTAWKVESTGRFVPHFNGRGHANQWPSTTAAHGISNGTTPKAGAVAVDMSIQPYGHTMYVEEVLNGGSQIRISEYNLIPYQYSERIISAHGLTYVYF